MASHQAELALADEGSRPSEVEHPAEGKSARLAVVAEQDTRPRGSPLHRSMSAATAAPRQADLRSPLHPATTTY